MRLIKIYLIFRYFRFLFYMAFSNWGLSRSSGLPPSRSNEVWDIVSNHQSKLSKLKRDAYDEIDKWARDLTDEINEHARSQKGFIEHTYKELGQRLDLIQRQRYDILQPYELNREDHKINQFIQKLNDIRIELVKKKKFLSVTKDFIELELVENFKEMDIGTLTSTTNSNSSSTTRSATGGTESSSSFVDSSASRSNTTTGDQTK